MCLNVVEPSVEDANEQLLLYMKAMPHNVVPMLRVSFHVGRLPTKSLVESGKLNATMWNIHFH